MNSNRTRVAKGGVLVLGGGFAGSYVARELGRTGATIVNPTNFMLYTPLLPEAAAGSVEPRHVAVPLRTMAPDADLVLGSAVGLDPTRRIVEVESDAGRFDLAYADLVVALGAVTRMPDIPGLRAHAFGLKDLADAIRLRNHVLRQVELADAAPDQAARRLTFVFAGAGFAGVEVLAELHELVSEALPRHPRLAGIEPTWLLLDGGRRILRQMPEELAEFAHRTLGERGVEILTATSLASIEPGVATLSGGRRIETETVVWTAGVTPNPLLRQLNLPLDGHGRVRVDETLRVVGAPGVWALGDCAAVPNEATPGETDPATCQHALRQARLLARNLRGTPRPYRYRTRGQMATLGRRHGVALIGRLPVNGLLGWHVARGYHLLQLPFAARRLRVLADWTTAALFRRDVAELSHPGARTDQGGESGWRPDVEPDTRRQAHDMDSHEAVLFDLDGVLTSTAALHARCWKEVFDDVLVEAGRRTGTVHEPFDIERDYLAHVDGKARADGVRDFLRARGIDVPEGHPDSAPDEWSVHGIGNRKQALVERALASEPIEAFAGAVRLVRALREAGVRTAVVSSSANCDDVLRAAGIADLFELTVDGNDVTRLGLRGKPAPDGFLEGARRLAANPERTVVVEDALAGVAAGRTGGFGLVVGVARNGTREELLSAGADLVVADLGELVR